METDKQLFGENKQSNGRCNEPKHVKDIKAESKNANGHPNLIQATFQKMFHLDVPDKPKSTKSSSNTSSESEEDKGESNVPRGEKRLSSTTAGSKLRFQKLPTGSHAHNLQPSKRAHRVSAILRELGFISNNHHEEQTQPSHSNASSEKSSRSECSFAEKYGTCKEIIGKGAFGIVRIAHKAEAKTPGGKLFAVKEFRRRHNEPAKKYIKRLTSEFCISSSLHHLNVIDTLDLLQDTQGKYCEVMEYCAGGDLYSLIVASGGLELEEADCFFGQLINGVKYLHDNGVAHRDLKPENLLLTAAGCLKITDFGNGECFRMAWETQAHLSRGVCGSEPYIAPEEFTGNWFDPRLVDIWACGIIYMCMITGRHLWRIAKWQEDGQYRLYTEAKADGRVLSQFQGLSNGRRRVMSKIIEPNPKLRVTAEQITQDSWFAKIVICFRPLSTGSSSVAGTCASSHHESVLSNNYNVVDVHTN